MTKRHEAQRESLLQADDELRRSIIPVLQQVAARRNTGFFMQEQSEFWAEARRITKEAVANGESSDLAAFVIASAFEEANDLANEHRLGPIRLAERVLQQLGA